MNTPGTDSNEDNHGESTVGGCAPTLELRIKCSHDLGTQQRVDADEMVAQTKPLLICVGVRSSVELRVNAHRPVQHVKGQCLGALDHKHTPINMPLVFDWMLA